MKFTQIHRINIIAVWVVLLLLLLGELFLIRSYIEIERLITAQNKDIGPSFQIQPKEQEEASGFNIEKEEIRAFQLIGASFGLISPRVGAIYWREAARVREVRILSKTDETMLWIVGKNNNFLSAPYIVGSIPEGFIVKEGSAFEELTPGEVYQAELRGEIDGESFDIAFNFNVPEI